jgi:hypothetical protein
MRTWQNLQYLSSTLLVLDIVGLAYFSPCTLKVLYLLGVVGGYKFEGLCVHTMPLIAIYPLFILLQLFGFYFLGWLVWTFGVAVQLYVHVVFGNSDFSKFKPSGPYPVGFRDWTTKTGAGKIDCSVYYPGAQNVSHEWEKGALGVYFYPYLYENVLGSAKAAKSYSRMSFVSKLDTKLIFMPFLNSKQNYWRNRKLSEVKELVPIVFSHGCHTHRHAYTALYGELASHGYLVIALGHNDGSADFSPYKGHYNKQWIDGEMPTPD